MCCVLLTIKTVLFGRLLSMGLAKMNSDKQSFTVYRRDNQTGSLKSNSIRDLLVDTDNTLWVASDHGGLARFDATSGQFITQQYSPFNPAGLSSNQVRSLFQDRDGNYWVGTFPNGINFTTNAKAVLKYLRNTKTAPTIYSAREF